jgi:RNA polymerase sigma-70 factor (ECF subfamily)
MDELVPDSAATQELLSEASAGSRQAYDRLFARHRARLHEFVALRLDPRLRPRIDADDVVQDTQLAAFRGLAEFLGRRPMPFHLWLRKKAYERLTDMRRRHVGAARRTVHREVALPDRSSRLLAQRLMASGSTPSQQLAQRELARRVQLALAGMSEADRDILFMRNYEGLSYEEAASILDIDTAAARKRHGRALLRLHKLLADEARPEESP